MSYMYHSAEHFAPKKTKPVEFSCTHARAFTLQEEAAWIAAQSLGSPIGTPSTSDYSVSGENRSLSGETPEPQTPDQS